MIPPQSAEVRHVNARRTDAFDLFHFRHYIGPNPYLPTAAYVFDFALTGNTDPLPIEAYLDQLGDRYPQLWEESYESHAHLFARTLAEANTLDMDLHFDRWSIRSSFQQNGSLETACIAIQSLHAKTSRALIYGIWDWFEAITRKQNFTIDEQIKVLQNMFRQSVYGGPTVYALLKTAHALDIPAFYLWDEGLMQYGYGRKQVRGSATTFDVDSHIDSDFTTQKDDCKRFLNTLGFPVPQGDIVYTLSEAYKAVDRIGYPVAVKPVVGHKGIGVTADIRSDDELEQAFDRAKQAIAPDQPTSIIVEQSVSGKDYRLLCVNGRFVAATERKPAFVVGNGRSTIQELIDRENQSAVRLDTPTSPMGKIKTDDAMLLYLEEQKLSLDTVLEEDETVYLRKVANLSSGGISIDATPIVHPDNVVLAQDIAQHFRLTCLGIDVISSDISESWKDGRLGILEINAAPGVYMHLRPAIGASVDVPAHILKTFFASGEDARIPIITVNRIDEKDLQDMIDHILLQHPDMNVGGVCQQTVLVNRSVKEQHPNYNVNVQNLLRHPKLDMLIVEYSESVLEDEGMLFDRSDLVILDNPTDVEQALAQLVAENATIVSNHAGSVSIQRNGLVEQYDLRQDEPFIPICLREITAKLLPQHH